LGRFARTFRSLESRNYRLFFFGELISHTGGWMHAMAEAWLVYDITGDGAAVGATFAFRFAPVFVFGLWGGALADRFDRRRLLLRTQLALAALCCVLWVLVGSGATEVWMVYGIALAAGLVTVVEQPTHHAFVEEMVGPSLVANAVALNSAVVNSARITGPALAGLVVAMTGTSWVFLGNALSYLAAVAALLAMRPAELLPLRRDDAGARIRDGLAYVRRTPALHGTIALVAVVGTLVFNFPTFITLLAADTFDGGAGTAGVLMAILGAGTLVGALGAAHLERQSLRTVTTAAAYLGVVMVLAAVLPAPSLVAVALLPLGAGAVFFGATASGLMQEVSAPQFRGRVMSMYSMLTLGATIVGGPTMGAVSGRWGARAGIGTAGAATATAALLVAVLSRPRLDVSVGVDARESAEAAQQALESA
jgi:MFS family permease